MAWERTDLIDWVLARIDEIAPTEQTAIPGRDAVGRELDQAALQMIRKVRKQLLYPAATNLATDCLIRKVEDEEFSLIIPLPTDFVRFLRLKVHGWNIPLDDLVSVDSNTYRQQINAFLRGTANQPVAALIPFAWNNSISTASSREDGERRTEILYKQAIEAFPPPDPDDLVSVGYSDFAGSANGMYVYMGTPSLADKHSPVAECMVVRTLLAEQIPDELVDAMVWLACGRALTSLRESNLATAAYANFKAAIDELSIGLKGEDMPPARK